MVFRGRIEYDPEEELSSRIASIYDSGNFEEAIDLLHDAIEKNQARAPKYREALVLIFAEITKNRIPTSHQQDDHDRLLYYANCMLKINSIIELPTTFQSLGWYIKGAALGKAGNHEEAVVCFDEAIRIEPEGANACEAWKDKGTAFYHLGDYEKALTCANKAIELAQKPDYATFRGGAEQLKKLCLKRLGSG